MSSRKHRHLPLAVASAVALACTLLHLLGVLRPDIGERIYLLSYSPERPTLLGAVLSNFVHAGPLHLLANMTWLLVLGWIVEAQAGPAATAALFLVAGSAAAWAQGAFEPNLAARMFGIETHVVGASGGMAALLGFAALARRGTTLAVGLAWVAYQIFCLLLAPGEVAYAGHLAGFLLGSLAGWARLDRARLVRT